MKEIVRAPAQAAGHAYDLAIIGGGVYGIMTAYEAVKRGLKCILVERYDFGGQTTFNWLRILHGGLRYLQSLDLVRFSESVGERRWFVQTFPEHVQVLPCLMPLYNRGIRRTDVFRLALLINDLLSRGRNKGIQFQDLHLADGQILDSHAVHTRFPRVDPRGLTGGALWYDAVVPDSQRLIIDLLKTACAQGAVALNHMEALRLKLSAEGRVLGITALDAVTGDHFEIQAPVVVNAAGPWCRETARAWDKDYEALFHPSIAWNLLVDRPGLSDCALALSPPYKNAHTYFLLSWKGKMIAGTGHRPWTGPIVRDPAPSEEQLTVFLNDLNAAVPGLDLGVDDILHVFGGYLPAARPDSAQLSNRPVIVDHGKENGIHGLYSVSGVKFTTARLVVNRLLSSIFNHCVEAVESDLAIVHADPVVASLMKLLTAEEPSPDAIRAVLGRIAKSEGALSAEDLLTRRLGLIPQLRCQWPSLEMLMPTAEIQNVVASRATVFETAKPPF
jgi:glycerol-3-phosphate dehydrogenase